MALLPPALACKEAIYSELLAIAEQACPAEAGSTLKVGAAYCTTSTVKLSNKGSGMEGSIAGVAAYLTFQRALLITI
eukprot:scaffold176237_cov18-Tisochrysis_lutea.AAC.2